MKQEIWYNPKFNCMGVLTYYLDDQFGTDLSFEIETKSGPVINHEKWLLPNWVLLGEL